MTAQEYEQFLFPNLTFCIFAENDSCYMDIHEIINKIYPIPETSMDKLTKHLSKVTYPKGHHILEAGKTETNIFFIEKGIVRAYIPVDGKEVTFWIGKEGSAIVSLKSYVDNQQGYESMELMEESELYLLKRKDLQELFKEDIHIANWGRKFSERECIKSEKLFISRQFKTSLERYQELISEYPDILQRVPLGIIASYLGISQVNLSRIRAKIR